MAEEALHDAFRAALEQWSRDGLRRQVRFDMLEDADALADPASETATRMAKVWKTNVCG